MNRLALLAAVLPLLPLLVLLLSRCSPEHRQGLLMSGDEEVRSQPFALRDGWLGSPRIALKAALTPNTSLVLSIALLDPAGTPVLQLSKEGWREQGTWSEDGESGTYDESDDTAVVEMRPPRSGDYRLVVERDEWLDAAGRPLSGPLPLTLSVRNHDLDSSLLQWTAVISALLVCCYWRAVYGHCRRRVLRKAEDTAIALRLEAGGPGLIRLRVRARYERDDSIRAGAGSDIQEVPVELMIQDAWGRPLLGRRLISRVGLMGSREDSRQMQCRLHLRLETPTSLRVRAEVPATLGGGEMAHEWLELLLEDGVVTPWPAEVIPLSATASGEPGS